MKYNPIIPLCIYHYRDFSTNTYLGYIGNALKVKDRNEKFYYKCKKIKQNHHKWSFIKSFFVFSPLLRPIPIGMKLFRVKNIKQYPYNSTNVELVYDPYNIEDDAIYFITYNQHVLNTKPLYLHTIENTIFPSFDKNPPTSDKNWSQTTISPIYVMTNETVGNNLNTIMFNCINNRCMPYNKRDNANNIWNYGKPITFTKCFTECNLLNFDSSKNFIYSHLKNPKNNTIKYGIKYVLIIVLLCILMLILLLKNKFDK